MRIRLRLDTPNVLPSMDVQDFVYLGGISHAHFSLDCLGIFSTILAALRLAKFLKLTPVSFFEDYWVRLQIRLCRNHFSLGLPVWLCSAV